MEPLCGGGVVTSLRHPNFQPALGYDPAAMTRVDVSTRRTRVAALVAAGAAGLCAAASFSGRQWLGFPDGHLTAHDRAYGDLLSAQIGISGTAAVLLTVLGLTRARSARAPIVLVIVLFVLVIAALTAYAEFGLRGLEHGQGG